MVWVAARDARWMVRVVANAASIATWYIASPTPALTSLFCGQSGGPNACRCGGLQLQALQDMYRNGNRHSNSHFSARALLTFPSLDTVQQTAVVQRLVGHVQDQCR